MPFGAEVLGDGGVRFRLWAPGARQVDLVLQQQAKPMVQVGEGWYERWKKRAPGRSLLSHRRRAGRAGPGVALPAAGREGPSEVIDPHASSGATRPGAAAPGRRR